LSSNRSIQHVRDPRVSKPFTITPKAANQITKADDGSAGHGGLAHRPSKKGAAPGMEYTMEYGERGDTTTKLSKTGRRAG